MVRRYGCLVAIGLAVLPGCRRAAFNELYVENMAGEIRALEDRVYEYDSAYQALELENEDLRRAVEDLRIKQRSLRGNAGESSSLLAPNSESIPKPSRGSKPKSQPRSDLDIGPSNSGGIDLSPKPATGGGSGAKPQLDKTPPSLLDKQKSEPGGRSLLDSAPDVMAPPPRSSTTPNSNPAPPGIVPELPPSLPSSSESLLPPPIPNKSEPAKEDLKTQIRPPNAKELVEDFEVPQGVIRSAQQPQLREGVSQPVPPSAAPSPMPQPKLPKLPQGGTLQGKIKLPADANVIPASAQKLLPPQKSDDTKIVEIAFHETLCRGHNFDDKPGDDGLYLVLTPKNKSGQPINQIGSMTVVVEEIDGDMAKRVVAWEVSPEELQESLEPIGVSQGFHLSLPWDGTEPSGNRVQVFVKYALEDGRSLVNRRDITLRKPGSRQTTWTPR